MRVWMVAIAIVAVAFAGCSDEPTTQSEPTSSLPAPPPPEPGFGVVYGVVVDQAIRPLAGARVVLEVPGTPMEQESKDDGSFVFENVEPGEYVLRASLSLHEPAQTIVTVVEDQDPKAIKLLLTSQVSKDAYTEQQKFTGFIQCGWALIGVTSLCVNDYSTLAIPGGCCPELRELVDNRGYVSTVNSGWETIVVEMYWEPSAQATSSEMLLLVSHTNRTSGDWFGQETGESPTLLRFEVGEQHPSGAGEPPIIPPEGMENLYTYGGIDGTAAVGISQEFEIIQTNFYNSKAPDGWSFVNGDPLPF